MLSKSKLKSDKEGEFGNGCCRLGDAKTTRNTYKYQASSNFYSIDVLLVGVLQQPHRSALYYI